MLKAITRMRGNIGVAGGNWGPKESKIDRTPKSASSHPLYSE